MIFFIKDQVWANLLEQICLKAQMQTNLDGKQRWIRPEYISRRVQISTARILKL